MNEVGCYDHPKTFAKPKYNMPPQSPLGRNTRGHVILPETTHAKATGHIHTTNIGQQKTQNSSGKGMLGQEIDGVRFKPGRNHELEGNLFPGGSSRNETLQKPNTNQNPGPSSSQTRPSSVLLTSLVGMVSSLTNTKSTAQKEENWQHQRQQIAEQYRKETVDIKEQHRKEMSDIKEQHRKWAADIKGQHHKETRELKKQLDKTRIIASSWKTHFESSNANSSRKYNDLHEAYNREQREKERLSAENSRQVVELQEYVKRLDRLAVVVENKQLYVGPQESDQKLINDFEEIFRLVKRFSLSFLTDHQVSKQELKNSNFHELLQGIVTGSECGYIQLLGTKKTRRLLVQGIIAYKLAHSVFRLLTNDPGTPPAALDTWSKRNAVAIDGIEQTLWEGQPEITARELNDWRALTISLLSRAENNISETTTPGQTFGANIVATIIDEVMGWIAEWAKPQEVYEELQDQLQYILQAAVDLSLQFRKQRAWWFVKLPPVTDGVIIFDPTAMEDIDNKKNEDGDEMQIGKTVALAFFPGLYKCGDADGNNYNSAMCMVRAHVKCLAKEAAGEPAKHDNAMKSQSKTVRHPPFPEVAMKSQSKTVRHPPLPEV
ncbi:hypothetical protein L211DRAFT_408532 [Terfezia boudieri ATCC MYA-4762]|uniref:Uncharacterized protein n=1 Tax=Terfezia boudieri ATCC MYA-4762 TaxID=1051890 RepID=A0A3N4LMD6_9PEZI|nr:hypothetical protein L211DRAFT_408532 [Terfezia boudieri ATCC MYA-4762]